MKTSNRNTAISAATLTHGRMAKERFVKNTLLFALALMAITSTSCDPSHSIASRNLTVECVGASGSVECTILGTIEGNTEFNIAPQNVTDTKSCASIPGKMVFTVGKGQFNVTCKPSAGLEMENSSINVPMPDSDHSITVVTKKVDGSVTPTDVDLTVNIAAANFAGGEIDAACLPKLVTDTAGYKAGSVTRDALVASVGDCSAKKQSAVGVSSLLSLKLEQALASNPKRAEAQTALTSLNRKIEDAEKAIVAAWAALTAVTVVNPPDSGQPDSGQPDSGQPDAGQPDSGQPDSGQPDAGQPDSGQPDSGQPDSGQPDAGQPDSGQPDSGQPDSGQPDSGQPDAGPACQGVPEGALTMGPNPMVRVDMGGPALDISSMKVFQCQSGVLVSVTATCGHLLTVDVAAITNDCHTVSPGGVAGCEWAVVSYPGMTAGTRLKMFNWANGATGPCPP